MSSKQRRKPSRASSKLPNVPHRPVLADTALAYLRVRPDGHYVDATAGAGGHSALIAEQLTSGRLIAVDRDPSAVALASKRLKKYKQARVVQGNYGNLGQILADEGLANVDGVLIDAGVSSMQLDEAGRGFSLQEEGPLDMRMTPEGTTAATFLSTLSVEELRDILKKYGDVPKARRIAKAILARRNANTLNTTSDLREAVAEGLGITKKTPDEAYQVFQAIRIAVNDELRWLDMGVEQAVHHLNPEGRIVVISFHSGEDGVVKKVLKKYSKKRHELKPDGRIERVIPPELRLVTKRPVTPTEAEIRENPRARSAKLRAAEKLALEKNSLGEKPCVDM